MDRLAQIVMRFVNRCRFVVFTFIVAALAFEGMNNASSRSETPLTFTNSLNAANNGYQLPLFDRFTEEKSFYLRYALSAIEGRLEIPNRNADVRRDGEIVTVTFPVIASPTGRLLEPGAAYTARVKFERHTGRVVEVLCGS